MKRRLLNFPFILFSIKKQQHQQQKQTIITFNSNNNIHNLKGG